MWHSFEPSRFFPEPLQRAVSALTDAVGALAKVSKVTERALKIAQKIAEKASVNPAETALNSLLDEVDRFVGGITGGTQAHAILLPVKRRVIRRSKGSSGIEDFLDPNEPASAYVRRALSAPQSRDVFYNLLAESVADAGDLSRPQFPPDYAVTGVCVLATAETLADLQIPLRLFTTLFQGNLRMAPLGASTPVVQGVRATPVAVRGGVGVVVRWDPLPPVNTAPLLTGELIAAEEIFIIRISAPFTRGWFTWSDLFNKEPSDVVTDLAETKYAKVVARVRNNGFVRSYTDSSELLNPAVTYYYTTCVRTVVNTEVQPMGALSAVVRVARTNPQPSSRLAVPPDWYATPTLTEMFPVINGILNRVRLEGSRLRSITTSNSGGQQLLQQTINQYAALAAQYQATVDETKELTDRLQALSASETPGGLYATTITRSKGGMDAWLAELARRLNDPNDESAPVMTSTSLVLGLVIVAGAPTVPDLAAVVALFEMFFGRGTRNPLRDVVANIGGTGGEPAAQSSSASSRVLGYTPDMLPSRTPTC